MFKIKIESFEKSDREFYEMVIGFTVKCIEGAFERWEYARIHEEVHRLFRTNAFNIAQRMAHEKQQEVRFPELKKPPGEKDKDLATRLLKRSTVPKPRFDLPASDIKPLYYKQTPLGSTFSRTAMMSMIFPSMQDKMRSYKSPRNSPKRPTLMSGEQAQLRMINSAQKNPMMSPTKPSLNLVTEVS